MKKDYGLKKVALWAVKVCTMGCKGLHYGLKTVYFGGYFGQKMVYYGHDTSGDIEFTSGMYFGGY